jgi:hypothetical protein
MFPEVFFRYGILCNTNGVLSRYGSTVENCKRKISQCVYCLMVEDAKHMPALFSVLISIVHHFEKPLAFTTYISMSRPFPCSIKPGSFETTVAEFNISYLNFLRREFNLFLVRI